MNDPSTPVDVPDEVVKFLEPVDNTARERFYNWLNRGLWMKVMQRGTLATAKNPSAVLEKRMECANGAPLIQPLPLFIQSNDLDAQCGDYLRSLRSDVLRTVLSLGSVTRCTNPLSVLTIRANHAMREISENEVTSLADMERRAGGNASRPQPQPVRPTNAPQQRYDPFNNLPVPLPAPAFAPVAAQVSSTQTGPRQVPPPHQPQQQQPPHSGPQPFQKQQLVYPQQPQHNQQQQPFQKQQLKLPQQQQPRPLEQLQTAAPPQTAAPLQIAAPSLSVQAAKRSVSEPMPSLALRIAIIASLERKEEDARTALEHERAAFLKSWGQTFKADADMVNDAVLKRELMGVKDEPLIMKMKTEKNADAAIGLPPITMKRERATVKLEGPPSERDCAKAMLHACQEILKQKKARTTP